MVALSEKHKPKPPRPPRQRPPARRELAHIVHSVAMCPPAQRCILLTAQSHGGVPDWDYHHVLALQTIVQHVVSRPIVPGRFGDVEYPDVASAERDGFSYLSTTIETHPVIRDHQLGVIVPVDRHWLPPRNAVMQMIVCDWPESEDECQLDGYVHHLVTQVMDMVNRAAAARGGA